MFGRAARGVGLGTLARCQARPPVLRLAQLRSRAWPPAPPPPLGRRYRSTLREAVRAQFRASPIGFPIAVGILVWLSGMWLIFLPWYYEHEIIRPYIHFPDEVAKPLRKAVFYSKGQHVDFIEANRHFRHALDTAEQMGMDSFGDEVLSIKYLIAGLYEHAHQYTVAVDVLEIMRHDCRRWMDDFSHSNVTNGNRSRVKKNIILLNLKLGELYDLKYVNQPDMAEKRLVEAVESALGELQRREREPLEPGEGPWMTDDEIGTVVEALGTHYERFDAHYLATPLFVKALEFCPPNSCHRVVLMNNISTCLAQQKPPSTASANLSPDPSLFPVTAPAPRAIFIDQAHQWAAKALAQAASIAPPDRTDECDIGCAVATHNLGEFFEMEGKLAEARQRYEEAASLAKAAWFKEGRVNARAALARVKEAEGKAA